MNAFNEEEKPKKELYPAVDPLLKVTQCVCKGKVFFVLSLPAMRDGSAQIKALNCVTCGALVELSDEARVGTGRPNVYVDEKGKKHHTLHADPLDIGFKGGGIGGGNGNSR